MVVHHRLTFVLLLVLFSTGGCKRHEESASRPSPPPADHLAKGEIVEGKENAFGLVLPRASKIEARFTKTMHVSSALSVEDLTTFVKARVKGKPSVETDTTARFDDVDVGKNPATRVSIEIRRGKISVGAPSEMIVTDTTPPPTEPNLSNEERWKKVGLTPDGKLVDPQHLE